MQNIDEIIKEVKGIGETCGSGLAEEVVARLQEMKKEYEKAYCGKYYYAEDGYFNLSGYYYVEKLVFREGKVVVDGWRLKGWRNRKEIRTFTVETLTDYTLCEVKEFGEHMKEFDPENGEDWTAKGFRKDLADLKYTVINMK